MLKVVLIAYVWAYNSYLCMSIKSSEYYKLCVAANFIPIHNIDDKFPNTRDL